jgi:PAS domain S-box-containing protein
MPNRKSHESDFGISAEDLLAVAEEGIFATDMDGICIYANPSCIKSLNLSHEDELIGKNIYATLQHSRADGTPFPSDESGIFVCLQENAPQLGIEGLFFREDGSSFQSRYSSHPMTAKGKLTGSVVSFNDISERASIEAALRRSDETSKKAQEIAHIGSWDWDILTGDLFWTDEIYRIFGLTPQQFGATYDAFLNYIHDDDKQAVIDAVNNVVEDPSKEYSIEHRVVQPDGEIRTVHERGKVYRDEKGQPIRMIGTVHDITERKNAEDEIKALNEHLEERVEPRTAELKIANDDLKTSLVRLTIVQNQLVQAEKMAALGGLVAGVAHEINTPIGIGVTAASHIDSETLKFADKYRGGSMTRNDLEKFIHISLESHKTIFSNLERAAQLVKSFKEIAVDQTHGEKREFYVNDYLQSVLKSIRPKFSDNQHQVEISCSPDLKLYADPGAFSQIITNLIINSLTHAFPESPDGIIHIELGHDQDGLFLRYHDNGIGMNEETKSKVFDPFFTTKRGQGGSGLGMHIVFNLVTQTLKSNIQCNSEEGNGTEFLIRLNDEYLHVNDDQHAA